jgi:hypothetical protein
MFLQRWLRLQRFSRGGSDGWLTLWVRLGVVLLHRIGPTSLYWLLEQIGRWREEMEEEE